MLSNVVDDNYRVEFTLLCDDYNFYYHITLFGEMLICRAYLIGLKALVAERNCTVIY